MVQAHREDHGGAGGHRDAAIRKRALLAAGRIGNEDSLPQLGKLLQDDPDPGVRAMAAFASPWCLSVGSPSAVPVAGTLS